MIATIQELSALTLAFASPNLPLGHKPHIRAGTSTSTNWAGYAVTGPSGSVTYVKGSFKVPTVTSTSINTYAAFWVGIDGYSSNTVEQIGVDCFYQNGGAVYYAWYEFYPKSTILINSVTVRPGDVIMAEVKYEGSVFTVSITDVTTGQSFSTSDTASSALRSSAEWIVEAPYSGGILPLANFGTAYMGSVHTSVTLTCYATVSGTTGPIGSFGSSIQQTTMVSSSGTIIAQPSTLSSDGTSFTVQRVNPESSGSPPSFDFSVSLSPTSASVMQGGSAKATTTVSLISGTAQAVSLSASVSPATTTISTSFSSSNGNPTFTSSLNVATTTGTPPGTYTITIKGSGGGLTRSTSYKLTVTSTSTNTKTLRVVVRTDKTSYKTSPYARIRIQVTDGSTRKGVAGATVTVTVTDPKGVTSSYTTTTGSDGVAYLDYSLNNAIKGTYSVKASASAPGYVSASGSVTFRLR